MDATINHLEKEKEKLQSRVDEMSDDLNRLDELKSMLDEARSDNERLQKQNSTYEYDIVAIRQDNDNLSSQNEANS